MPKHELDTYNKKRDQGATPEPFSGKSSGSGLAGGGLFVVQKHAARRTHYDLRLELDGVLKSWAVPRGFSLDPTDKRFAAETEDHPFEYGDFEGVIPEGNYGAGAMIVWDRGLWIPLEEPESGWEKGKLLFELRGYKLRGVWTLFRTKPPAIHRGKKDEDKSWLLMKKPDQAARTDDFQFAETSVLSGLTVEELAHGTERIHEVEVEVEEMVEELELPAFETDPRKLKLMLAQNEEKPFSRKKWIFELKYDGYRLLVSTKRDDEASDRKGGDVFLRYRNGHDASHLFPELVRSLKRHPVSSMTLDGEVVVLNADGRPSFNRLQRRAMLTRKLDIDRATLEHPASLFVFDLLEFAGHDLRDLPLTQRKRFLKKLMPPAGPVRYLDHIPERGADFYQQIVAMGLEGMVAKRAASPYVGQRSDDWIKVKADQTGDFVIVGHTKPKTTRRKGFGALHLAFWDPSDGASERGGLVYAGRVGTGFNQALLDDLSSQFQAAERDTPAFSGEPPTGDEHVWVEPELICEVRFKEWTHLNMLRHPVFLRLRDDKQPYECTGDNLRSLEDAPSANGSGSAPSKAVASHEPPTPAPPEAARKVPEFTNQDKIFWPEDGYTKGDLIEFYRAAAPTMMRYLVDRPVVLTRYPDGIHGKSFYQKNAPDFAPDWIRTVKIWSGGSERDIEYFVCDDEDSLLYLANLGSIVLHVWSSRMQTLDKPDWCILDLDPKEAPFTDVVKIARAIRALCNDIGMPSFVKTSGSTGLHVLLPLGQKCSYEQSRTLGQLIANLIAQQHTDIATVTRNPARRDGKVYVDYLQNGHGRLLVSPFSVRPKPGAPVSTPLHWREVTSKLTIEQHNIRSVPKRLARQKKDPLAGVLEEAPELVPVLEKLSKLL